MNLRSAGRVRLLTRSRAGRALRKALAGALGSAALLMLWFAGAARAQSPAEELASARSRWQGAGVTGYVFVYQKHCPCYRDEPATTFVTVTDGAITRVHYRHAGADEDVVIAADRIEWYWTVPDLFDVIAAALADPAVEVRVSYESARGVPTYLYLDYDRAMVGDEIELRVHAVTEQQ